MKTFLTTLMAVGLLAGSVFGQSRIRHQDLPRDHLASPAPLQFPETLTRAQLRDIDRLVVRLSRDTRRLHDEYHEHLEGVRHAEKLDDEVTTLEKIADSLHDFASRSDGGPEAMARLRSDTNEFLQLSFRIERTIELTDPWLRTRQAHTGIDHMRTVARNVMNTAMQIDACLPPDVNLIDNQADRLEQATRELHAEFHEHLEGYEVSRHLDADLEDIERLVEHMHDLAHDRTWGEIDFRHLLRDIAEVKEKTAHIDSLFVRQARIGVRTRDWIGIEHSRDAMTDVLSSTYLLEHMIRKTNPRLHRSRYLHESDDRDYRDYRPRRDRHHHDPYRHH